MAECLRKGQGVTVDGKRLDACRLAAAFENYFLRRNEELRRLSTVKEDMGLEYAMAQVFSPRQKELFLKRLRNEKMTKTEKEYFSRVVKKKLTALANQELHRLARQALE